MNELVVFLEGGQWIYFPTPQERVDKAFQEFNESCDSAGFIMDNVHITEVTLRDENCDDIDSIKF